MGRLVLLTTPIGNSGDWTQRGLEALRSGTCFAVEDTRSFLNLLGSLSINAEGKLIDSFHDQSTPHKLKRFRHLLDTCAEVILVSEAGGPLISDPGYPLVCTALEDGHELVHLPGASSVISALEISGLAPQPFHFVGFLPRGSGDFDEALNKAEGYGGTVIFFESPKRVLESMDRMVLKWPEGRFCLAREITKTHESVHRFSAAEWPEVRPRVLEKGEFVVLVNLPRNDGAAAQKEWHELAESYLQAPSPRALAKLLGEILDRPSKEIYAQLDRAKK